MGLSFFGDRWANAIEFILTRSSHGVQIPAAGRSGARAEIRLPCRSDPAQTALPGIWRRHFP